MTKTVKRQELISHTYNDFEFKQRSVDGYVDATALCTANGKKSNDYFRSQDSQEFVDELILTTGIPAIKLIEKKEGRYGGTFVHPLIANDIARWCSARCAVFVSFLIEAYKQGRLTYNRKRTKQQNPLAGDKRQDVIAVTKDLSQTILAKLCQDEGRIYQHIEDTVHAVVTGMSAKHHKQMLSASNGVDLLCRTELDIYDMVKRMIQTELEKYPNASLTRERIRAMAKDIGDKCSKVVTAHEAVGSIAFDRHVDILPQSQKKIVLKRSQAVLA